MTGPIINPWWLYLYNVIGGVHAVLGVFLILGIVGFLGVGLFLLLAGIDMRGDEDVLVMLKKLFKQLSIALVCIIGAYILVPNQDLMMKMFIFDNITYENLETVGGITKEGFDYVMESIDELINKETVEEEEE